MEKLKKLAIATLCIAAAAILPSCDDDEWLKVNEDVTTNGITADAMDGEYAFFVDCGQKWTATLPDDCDWATLLSVEGTNSENVTVMVDANGTGIERSTVITVASGSEKVEIALRQTAPDDNDADLIKLAGKKYLGYGCNMLEFFDDPKNNPLTYRTCNVINTAAIQKLLEGEDAWEYDNLANTTTLNLIDYEAIQCDTIVDKEDHLGISISIQIAYGLMKFGLAGAYHGGETFTGKTFHTKTGANYPTMEASINYRDAMAAYQDWVDEGCPSGDPRKSILTRGFISARDKLAEACKPNSSTSSQVNSIIGNIIRDYGTGVVTRSTLGGLIALELESDSTYIDEVYSLDSAKVTAAIKLGLFSLDVNVKATYLDSASSILRNSRHKARIVGGSGSSDVLSLLENAQYGTPLANAIVSWSHTIVNANDNTNTAELIAVDVQPIWVLFDDENSIEAIKSYLKQQHPGSKFVEEYIEKE